MSDASIHAQFKITLLQNGVHSLERGFEALDDYFTTSSDLLLKEAIMFFHHGVELLLKQLLVQQNEFLVFEDLRAAARKQLEAKRQRIGVFSLDEPPRTLTFLDAVERVEAFLDIPQFDDKLKKSLRRLNALRNKLEHYAAEADRNEIIRLLGELFVPLMQLFAAQIPDFRKLATRLDEHWREYELKAEYLKTAGKKDAA